MSRNSAGSSKQSHFAQIPRADIQRSTFDRSFTHKTTFDAGYLIPLIAEEILPGDTVKLTANLLARLATPLFPYMDNLYMDAHFFFVPNRLVWENWEKFNGAQDNPGDSTDFLVPQLDATKFTAGFSELSIYDYLGLPTKITSAPQSEMPDSLILRACNLIYNEWYRDENLQDSLEVPTDDGPDDNVYSLMKRGRRKDYFTSALPWPQKGPSVLLPLGTTAPVYGTQMSGTGDPNGIGLALYDSGGPNLNHRGLAYTATTPTLGFTGAPALSAGRFNISSREQFEANGFLSNVYADLTEATAATINQLREAFQLQRMFERDARGGTRYVELLLSHFGVVSPDFRLQRPEYLGGGTTTINVNPIAQTSDTTNDSPQGNLAAFASAHGRMGFNHSFVEHGHLIGFISVRADTTYQQGMNRKWTRRTRYDYYWPTLAHLGEQAVFQREIYYTNSATANDTVFGYQERFAEYRYSPSIVTGRFRSNAAQPLDAWHLALDFNTAPTLAGLVEENPPVDRIIAVQSEPQFILDSYTSFKHTRPMPTYSVPGLIDHF